MSWLYWLFILILLAAAGGAALLAYRTYVLGDTSAPISISAAGCSGSGPSRAWA